MKSVQIRSYFWSVFCRLRTDTKYLSVFSANAGKYGPEISPYLDTFHAVYGLDILRNFYDQNMGLADSVYLFVNIVIIFQLK